MSIRPKNLLWHLARENLRVFENPWRITLRIEPENKIPEGLNVVKTVCEAVEAAEVVGIEKARPHPILVLYRYGKFTFASASQTKPRWAQNGVLLHCHIFNDHHLYVS